MPEDDSIPESVVLIGPSKSGKSTVGRLISEKLGVPFLTCDLTQFALKQTGYDDSYADRLFADSGITAWYRYLLPYGVEALQNELAKSGPAVVELTRWYPDAQDAETFEPMRAALSAYEHVVMLKPDSDPDGARKVVRKRSGVLVDGLDVNAGFLTHHSNRDLANLTVYTSGRTPIETRDEILSLLQPGTVVLIGPIRAGKSTQGFLIAEALGRKRIAMDQVRWDYYKEIGWSSDRQKEIWNDEGVGGVLRYWKPFEIHAVERVLQEHPGCVIDFGAGHSDYEDETLFARAQAALEPIDNVVLLLPSPDVEESLEMLHDRNVVKTGGMDGDLYFLKSPECAALASQVIVTDGRTPEETCRDILSAIGLPAG